MTRDVRSTRAYGVFLGAVSALSLLASPGAEAASPPITTQAAAANAAFLAYAPPPAAGAKAGVASSSALVRSLRHRSRRSRCRCHP